MNPIVFSVTKISDDRGGLYNISTTDTELGDLLYPRIPSKELEGIKSNIKDAWETETRSVVFEEVE